MLNLIAATFSALKGAAIAVAAVNAAVIAAVLVCLFFLYRSAKKKGQTPNSSAECTITGATVKNKNKRV